MSNNLSNIEHIDSNIIIDYLYPDKDKYNDNTARNYFTPKNPYNREIRVYTYAIGEVFRNLFIEKNNKKISLEDQSFINKVDIIKSTIKIIKLEELDKKNEFIEYYKQIQDIDNRIHTGDIIMLSAFFCDSDAKIFRTFDKGILDSKKIIDYARGHNKKILEV
ncbi:MAG: hypothetical protein ACP5RS_07025 [Thermoplasmata archaeon]